MDKLLLLGDEAIAQGAIDGGLSGVYAYPGTPSTEITEYIQHNPEARQRGIHSEWSANEKTAMEAAVGMSYAGKRAMVCMKHVGLNVAADAFVNAAITGAGGGLVVTVADDPSMHSSQNEQDSRFYGNFAMIPILEPSNQQEAYEMTYNAFELSEKFRIPVMIRLTTRIAHSRSGVSRKPTKPENALQLPSDPRQFVLLPAIARQRYKGLLSSQSAFELDSEKSAYNQYFDAPDKSLGIIACGLAYNYLMENFQDAPSKNPILKIGQYPLPRTKIEKIMAECEKVLVLEDGYPLVEEALRGYLAKENVVGRLDGTVPRDGELDPNVVAAALGLKQAQTLTVPDIVQNRPPAMCDGCGHIDVYNALNEALTTYGPGRVFSDIGCYTLGALEPFNSINSCLDMGASITMAKGAADAGLHPVVAVIGDSTFTHSGMTGLLDCIVENTSVTVIISDNATTGMTGGQASHAKDRLLEICKGLGVHPDHIRTIVPLRKNHDAMVEMMKEEFEYQGVSVIIPQRECIQTMAKRVREQQRVKKMNL